LTIVKLTKNGKGVLIVDDFGNAYITSKHFMQGLLWGKSPHGFITTKRLPHKISDSRFKPSELYDPDNEFQGDKAKSVDGPLTTTNDALSVKVMEEKEQKVAYQDKNIWGDL
jgi:hypothetical protein